MTEPVPIYQTIYESIRQPARDEGLACPGGSPLCARRREAVGHAIALPAAAEAGAAVPRTREGSGQPEHPRGGLPPGTGRREGCEGLCRAISEGYKSSISFPDTLLLELLRNTEFSWHLIFVFVLQSAL